MPAQAAFDDDSDDEADPDIVFDDTEDDPTVPCPYCRELYHEESSRCPHCGQYISAEDAPPARKPFWIVVGLILAGFVALRWIL